MGNIFSISLPIDKVITSCAPSCVSFTVSHATYTCNPKGSLNSLEKALKDVKACSDTVNVKVEEAVRQGPVKLLPKVDLWLSKVNEWISEAEQLLATEREKEAEQLPATKKEREAEQVLPTKHEREAEQVPPTKQEKDVKRPPTKQEKDVKRRFLGRCPTNWWSNHKLGMKIAKKLKEVKDLKDGGQFEELVQKIVPPVIERPSKPIVGLESEFSEAWSALMEEEMETIALYGSGGVGKTTLLDKINNKLSQTSYAHEFDHVIYVTVSKDFNEAKVQEKIEKLIGLPTETEKTRDERAQSILRALKDKKFVLLLDDVWQHIDLTKLGVPLPSEKSRIVLTTRFFDVCTKMKAHKKIEVKYLLWEEAWELFRENVGEQALNADPGIIETAKKICKRCDGLPLALIVIGQAMSSKSKLQEWKSALRKLEDPASQLKESVFSNLMLSYDFLPSDESRNCFLYCALFPEDCHIDREELIEYWIVEGLIDYDDIDEATDEGYDIVRTLINVCLLQECYDGDVKLHDVIRDMALWITSEKNDAFLVKANVQLKEVPKVDEGKGIKRMNLMSNVIMNLTGEPKCRDLLTLFLQHNRIETIEGGFFKYMPHLKVLDLSYNRLKEMPEEISHLVSLQYLNLYKCGIKKLPIALRCLVNLKYLDARDIAIPSQVISGLSSLRVLALGTDMEEDTESTSDEALLKEMNCLKSLSWLHINTNYESLYKFVELQKVTKDLTISCTSAKSIDMKNYMNCLRSLKIESSKDLEAMDVDGIWGESSTKSPCPITTNGMYSFSKLQQVTIVDCNSLRDLTWLIFAKKLEGLCVSSCNQLEELICLEKKERAQKVQPDKDPFSHLRCLELLSLPKLKSINKSVLPFQCLEEMVVFDCQNLKKLPLNSINTNRLIQEIRGGLEWWNQLEWENAATKDAFQPLFKEF